MHAVSTCREQPALRREEAAMSAQTTSASTTSANATSASTRAARTRRRRRRSLVALLAVVPLVLLGSGTDAYAAACDGNWRVATPPSGLGLYNLDDVAVGTDGSVWAIGDGVDAADNWITVLAHRVGGAWTTAALPAGNGYRAVASAGGRTWLIGGDSAGNPLVLTSTGGAWTARATGAPAGASLYGISARTATDVWVVGVTASTNGTGHPLVLHYNGTSWRHWTLAGVGAAFDVAEHGGPADVWVGGDVPDPAVFSTQPVTWHWNGTSWTRSKAPRQIDGGTIDTIDVTAGGTVWGAGPVDAGDCCDSIATVVRHTKNGWTSPGPYVPVWTSYNVPQQEWWWNPTGVVASDAANGTTVVGYFFDGDSGGGTTWPVVATWTGSGWTAQKIRGLPAVGFDQGILLEGVAGGAHGDRWAVGGAATDAWRPLVVHQCMP
jgi:hypothetical protein